MDCVTAYFETGKHIDGLILHQNYAYMMMTETSSFQERCHFDLAEWQAEFGALCEKHLGTNRRFGM